MQTAPEFNNDALEVPSISSTSVSLLLLYFPKQKCKEKTLDFAFVLLTNVFSGELKEKTLEEDL